MKLRTPEMSTSTFEDLMREMFRLYEEKAYADGLAMLVREADRFSGHRSRTLFWCACFASLTGDSAGALQWLQTGVAEGEWFSPDQLRGDPDLKPLQGVAEFEHIVAYCEQRLAEAEKEVAPDRRVLVPQNIAPPFPLLIALHGYNVTQVYFETVHLDAWKPVVEMGWLLASPRASQRAGPDSYAWRDTARSLQEVYDHYTQVCMQYAIDPERIVISGFSRGGALALELALHARIPACGVIAVGPGAAVMRELNAWLPTGDARRARVYFVMGELDTPCLPEVNAMAGIFKSLGISYEIELHPNLGHEFPPTFEQSLKRALDFITQS
ncbi:MAG: dienelactone hydrolase family protein [Chloroflexi bacterium]|nr:dienelactone hydrolase family protein [Chloroflexota bacterium]